MKFRFKIGRCLILLYIFFLSVSWSVPENGPTLADKSQAEPGKAFTRNKNIGRGINFGNALEAPTEGEWGLVIKEPYIQAVADAGFNSVRLPICWSAHTGKNYPYKIDAAFLNRVDEVVNWCLNKNLSVIITIHHFNDLYNYPDNPQNLNMFFAIWKQLTDHYIFVDHEHLFFEVLNEPEINLTAGKWNQLMPQIIDTIRVKDSDRTLIIDAPDYASHWSLANLNIPQSEQNVIVSTRYYLPYQFAQQGAWWSNWIDLNQFLGTTWSGTNSEKNAVLSDMSFIKNWSNNNNRPITIGEYGSIMFADNQSRLTWTNYVRTQFENNGFSWSYFDFGVVFKAYSIAENKWLYGFVEALTGNSAAISDRRTSDSIIFSPLNPSKDDSILVTSYASIPNYCSKTDSIRITANGSTINIKSYHPEYIPHDTAISSCADSVRLGPLVPGDYKIIFDSEYIDKVNTLRYSIMDSTTLRISGSAGVKINKASRNKVYLSQASQFVMVDSGNNLNLYRIYNLKGQLQDAGKIEAGRINISKLRPGEYILHIKGNANSISVKIIVVRP